MALAGLAAQLALRQPAATDRDAWLQGQAHDADGVDVGELRDHEGPGAHVQADQPQRLGRGRGPQVAQQPIAGDQTAVLPAVEHVAQGRLAKLAGDPGRTGRQPTQEHVQDVGAGCVLLTQPAQSRDVAGGDAGVGVPTRTPRAAAWWRPSVGAVDIGAGPGAASPKEALFGHGWDLRIGGAGPGRSRRSGPAMTGRVTPTGSPEGRPRAVAAAPPEGPASGDRCGTPAARPGARRRTPAPERCRAGERLRSTCRSAAPRPASPPLPARTPVAYAPHAPGTSDLGCQAPGCSRHRRGHNASRAVLGSPSQPPCDLRCQNGTRAHSSDPAQKCGAHKGAGTISGRSGGPYVVETARRARLRARREGGAAASSHGAPASTALAAARGRSGCSARPRVRPAQRRAVC
jgi:hypothetical protein